MEFIFDQFNGVTLQVSDQLKEKSSTQFVEQLSQAIELLTQQNKQLIWLTLNISQSVLISSATELGFVFHNCQEDELTLIYRINPNAYAPFAPTHTLGVGALIKNANNEILVIKEHGMTGYKLPGGHLELGEKIETAVVREVEEETGIIAEFYSIIGVVTKYPYQFGKANMYLVCRLEAKTELIAVQDQEEVAEARWLTIADYLADKDNSQFNRQMVEELINNKGLPLFNPDNNLGRHKKQEVFFSND